MGQTSHYVYWFEKRDTNAVFNRAALPERAYAATDLASALQTALDAASWFGDNLYTCTFDETHQTITIARPSDGSRSFFVPSNDLMGQLAFQAQTTPMTVGSVPYTVNWSNLESAHDLLGLGRGTSANLDLPALLQLLTGSLYTSQETGAVDTRAVHNIYVTSNALSNNNVVGLRNSRSTVVKQSCSGP